MAWADDWRVADGLLYRPGRDPRPAADVGWEVEVDSFGNVVARSRGGRRVEILRADDGSFAGMRLGSVSARLVDGQGVASDGRTVKYTYDGTALVSVVDGAGRKTRYGWTDGRLADVVWADGLRAGLAEGQIEISGRWTCARDAARVRVTGPGGSIWLLDEDDEGRTVTAPGGARTRELREGGRLLGWVDPRGGRTVVASDGRGGSVEDPSGARWTWTLDAGRLGRLSGPMGSTWTIERDRRGAIVSIVDPAGRQASWTWTSPGVVHGVSYGGSAWTWERDRDGRIFKMHPPTGGEIVLGRDSAGRAVRLADGTGAAWTIQRDEHGQARVLTDPAGVTWTLRRDSLGRVTSITEPTGRVVAFARRDDGPLSLVTVGTDERWELLRSSTGALTGIRDPLGRLTGYDRDAADRVRAVRRADGSVVAIERDAAGDPTSVGGMLLRRDGVGRPLSVATRSGTLVWTRDGAGRVVGVDGPGVNLVLGRASDGAIREVRVAGHTPVMLDRDPAGRVVRARGALPVTIDRDARGLIVGLRREEMPTLRVARDLRGEVSQVHIGEEVWTFARDGAGRVLRAEGPGGLRLGVDRDGGGEPRLVRFPDGSMATYARSHEAVELLVLDSGGAREGGASWVWDVAGRVERIAGAIEQRLRRDPLGTLVAAEAGARTWSWSPGEVQGPDGARVRYDEAGRPRTGVVPEGAPAAWGVATGDVSWVCEEDGAMREVAGARGSATLHHDGLGRLLGWSGPNERVDLVWDALGRLARVGADATDGWGELMAWGAQRRVPVADVGVARAGGGLFFGPEKTPVSTMHGGDLELAPSGLGLGPAAGESAAGGRFAPRAGGPLLGLLDTIDPLSGQSTAAAVRFPWSTPAWEVRVSPSAWADPDGAAGVAWDPGPWAEASPWSDPLGLLVGAEVLPGGGVRAARGTGLPWLPADLAPTWPEVLPDPLLPPDEEEPELRWVLGHVLDGEPAAPESLTEAMIAEELRREKVGIPDLDPLLPRGLR